jgi:hypothetical protein
LPFYAGLVKCIYIDSLYPNFIVMLNDGWILVIECKGAHLDETPDTKKPTSVKYGPNPQRSEPYFCL